MKSSMTTLAAAFIACAVMSTSAFAWDKCIPASGEAEYRLETTQSAKIEQVAEALLSEFTSRFAGNTLADRTARFNGWVAYYTQLPAKSHRQTCAVVTANGNIVWDEEIFDTGYFLVSIFNNRNVNNNVVTFAEIAKAFAARRDRALGNSNTPATNIDLDAYLNKTVLPRYNIVTYPKCLSVVTKVKDDFAAAKRLPVAQQMTAANAAFRTAESAWAVCIKPVTTPNPDSFLNATWKDFFNQIIRLDFGITGYQGTDTCVKTAIANFASNLLKECQAKNLTTQTCGLTKTYDFRAEVKRCAPVKPPVQPPTSPNPPQPPQPPKPPVCVLQPAVENTAIKPTYNPLVCPASGKQTKTTYYIATYKLESGTGVCPKPVLTQSSAIVDCKYTPPLVCQAAEIRSLRISRYNACIEQENALTMISVDTNAIRLGYCNIPLTSRPDANTFRVLSKYFETSRLGVASIKADICNVQLTRLEAPYIQNLHTCWYRWDTKANNPNSCKL